MYVMQSMMAEGQAGYGKAMLRRFPQVTPRLGSRHHCHWYFWRGLRERLDFRRCQQAVVVLVREPMFRHRCFALTRPLSWMNLPGWCCCRRLHSESTRIAALTQIPSGAVSPEHWAEFGGHRGCRFGAIPGRCWTFPTIHRKFCGECGLFSPQRGHLW